LDRQPQNHRIQSGFKSTDKPGLVVRGVPQILRCHLIARPRVKGR